MRAVALALGLVALVGWPREGRVSRVYYEPVPLAQVVARAKLVVVGRLAEPSRTIKTFAVERTGREGKPVRFEHSVVRTRLVVEAVLQGPPSVKPGDTLDVVQATAGERFDLAVRYHVEGIRKSPIYESFADGEGLFFEPGTRGVYFLTAGVFGEPEPFATAAKGAWRTVVDASAVPLARREEVQALLTKGARKPH